MKRKLKLNTPRVSRFTLFILAGILVIGWLGISIRKELERKEQAREELASLKSAIEELEKENREILAKKEYLTSAENIEREARRRLNLKKQDENVAIIVPETNKGQGSPESQENQNPETDVNFFRKLWNLIF